MCGFLVLLFLPHSSSLSLTTLVTSVVQNRSGPNRLSNPNRVESHPPSLSETLLPAGCRFRCSWVEAQNVGPRIRYRPSRSGSIRIGVYSRWVKRAAWVPASPMEEYSRLFCVGRCGAISFPGTVVGRGMSFDYFVYPAPYMLPVFASSLSFALHSLCVLPCLDAPALTFTFVFFRYISDPSVLRRWSCSKRRHGSSVLDRLRRRMCLRYPCRR